MVARRAETMRDEVELWTLLSRNFPRTHRANLGLLVIAELRLLDEARS